MLGCLAGFDSIFLMSPSFATEQAVNFDDEWIKNFNLNHEIICMSALERKIDLGQYMQLIRTKYSFIQQLASHEETKTGLLQFYPNGITELYNLKRAIMFDISGKSK